MRTIRTKNVATLMMGGLLAVAVISCTSDPEPTDKPKPPQNVAIRLNVFFESSGSMDGYVTGNTEFEAAMMTMVGGIGRSFQKSHEHSATTASSKQPISYSLEGINLYTVASGANDSAAATAQLLNGSIDAIDSWFKRVEPATLGAGTGRRSTELKAVLKLALDSVKKGQVSMLVSDMILSPPQDQRAETPTVGGSSAMERILLKEQSQILNTFSEVLNTSKDRIAMLGYRFESRYDGEYTPEATTQVSAPSKRRRNSPSAQHVVMHSRPYFVWIIGNFSEIDQISRRVDLRGLRENRLTHTCLLIEPTTNERTIPFRVVTPLALKAGPDMGKYMVVDTTTVTVSSLSGNRLVYAVDVTLPVSLQYSQVEAIASGGGAGHIDTVLSCSRISSTKYNYRVLVASTFPRGQVPSYDAKTELSFYHRKPTWFTEFSVDDDNGTPMDTVKQRQTFGLRYLMEGVWRSFYPENPKIGTLTVHLNH